MDRPAIWDECFMLSRVWVTGTIRQVLGVMVKAQFLWGNFIVFNFGVNVVILTQGITMGGPILLVFYCMLLQRSRVFSLENAETEKRRKT